MFCNVGRRRQKGLIAGELARFRAGQPFTHTFDSDAAAKRAAAKRAAETAGKD
jgi:hypothetical protein